MTALRTVLRLCLASLVLLSLAGLGYGYVSWSTDQGSGAAFTEGERAAPPTDDVTVVTTSMYGDDFLVAFAPNGTVLYYDDEWDIYDDVDPSPEGDATVTYVATEQLDRAECHATEPCSRNVVERTNLTTGESEVLFSRVTAQARNHWHDVDRVGEDRWLVADIALDRVFVYNTTSDLIEWEWDVQSDYDLAGGGLFPGDWTHVNDVEQLPDGRVMVSLRNQDQVAFVHPERGHQANWTLGADDDHDTLYEQHNPDYIPEERGGPAVVLADSENNRVVEYEREDGEWRRTWKWSDVDMQWPRDADRLPNGHTLVTDTNGGRILEVDRDGEIVWQVDVKGAYEAERLETGDESAGGTAASELNLTSRTADTGPARPESTAERYADEALAFWKGLLPSMLVNPLLYVLPPWIGFAELAALLLLVGTALAWGALELRWDGWRLRSPLEREDG